MHVAHTPGDPPNQGKTYLAISGWTRKRRRAPVKMDPAKSRVLEIE
jgi:hypothetical protein